MDGGNIFDSGFESAVLRGTSTGLIASFLGRLDPIGFDLTCEQISHFLSSPFSPGVPQVLAPKIVSILNIDQEGG